MNTTMFGRCASIIVLSVCELRQIETKNEVGVGNTRAEQ